MKNWIKISLPKEELEELEKRIEKQIEEKINKKLFTIQDIKDLQEIKMDILPDMHQIRPFFLQMILADDSLFFSKKDYNLTPELLWHSSTSSFLSKIRKKLQPFLKIFANFEALIHKQALYNDMQVDFNTKIVHHLRLIHNIINNLVAELTKLKIENEELKYFISSLESQLNFYKEYQRALEDKLK